MYCFLNFHLIRLPLYLWVQSLNCVPLCKPLDCSPPSSCVHGIFQARILEWVAISFPRGSSRPRDGTQFSCISFIGRQILYHWATLFFLFSHESCPALCNPMDCSISDFPLLHYLLAAAAKSLQSCPTLCDPIRRQPTRLPRPWDSPSKNTGVGCHFLLQCMKVKSENEVAHSYLTLHSPMDCSPLGSSVHGIFPGKSTGVGCHFLLHTISWSLLKLMSIELVMPSNHLILCHHSSSRLQSFPASGSFSMSWLFVSGGQSIGAFASASILPN